MTNEKKTLKKIIPWIKNGFKYIVENKLARKLVIALLASGIFGLIGTIITSNYTDNISKREVTVKLIEMLSKQLIDSTSVPANMSSADPSQLSSLLKQKEQALMIRKTADFLHDNFRSIDFQHIRPALKAVETRYSYARLYEASGAVEIICENLYLPSRTGEKFLTIAPDMSRCNKDKLFNLTGVKISLASEIDTKNLSYKIAVEKDTGNYLCNQERRASTECWFNVDMAERLESLPFGYMIISEFIGYEDMYSEKRPTARFSIVKKVNKKEDRTYWTYPLNLSKSITSNTTCQPFFDDNPYTRSKPNKPEVDAFDRSVLRACGPLGGKATKEELWQLLYDHYFSIRSSFKSPPADFVGKDRYDFVNELHRIWSIRNGFNHIMCGEWEGGTIGGLHNRARYLQLQTEGAACYIKSTKENVDEGYVYTIGVASADGEYKHEIKGYSLNKSSMDILAFGTQAFYRYCKGNTNGWKIYDDKTAEKDFYVTTREKDKKIAYRLVCKAEYKPSQDDAQKAVLTPEIISGTEGILTLYPDITPNKEKLTYEFDVN
jgi:hypothetical protein